MLLLFELLLRRWGALLLEDPARMRDDHVGGMAAAARHRKASQRSEALVRGEGVYVADQSYREIDEPVGSLQGGLSQQGAAVAVP